MKLELIVPSMAGENREPKKSLCPPLTPAAIAALTPPEVEVSITDENVTAIDFQKETDLVGITVLTATAKRQSPFVVKPQELWDIFDRGIQ